MEATKATHSSTWDEIVKPSAEEVYEGFRNVLDWTEGFGLVFVQCSPVQGSELIEQIQKDLPNKRVEILRFKEGEEIRNLYNLVEALPNHDQIDVLFIRGLEYSFVPYIKPGYGGQGDYYKLDNLPPILGHLNLQRERFRNDFEICFVFLLPFFGIKYFIQRAPDFFDWRLGLFRVSGKKDLIGLEIFRLIEDANYDQYCQWNFSQRMTRILEIETLLKEDLESEDKSFLLLEQGNLWVVSSANKEAITSYDQALEIKPDFHYAWYNRGVALFNLDRYEEAIASYDQALKIKPDFYSAWYNRGNTLFNLGKYEEAIASYDHALKIKPNDNHAWHNRGYALNNLGRYEKAIASYDKALKIEPNFASAYFNKACVYALQENLDLALKNLTQAINLDSQYLENAKTDADFDKIRHTPSFQRLIAEKH
ncbi:MAG: tetratricopeptide repeat protein [Cyanobacteriota bacterium]